MLKTLKELRNMQKRNHNEHLDYVLRNSTPYQRMIWLKRAFEFWKSWKYARRKKIPQKAAR